MRTAASGWGRYCHCHYSCRQSRGFGTTLRAVVGMLAVLGVYLAADCADSSALPASVEMKGQSVAPNHIQDHLDLPDLPSRPSRNRSPF